jgi:hypothetical protein
MVAYKSVSINCAAMGDNLLVAGVAGQVIRVHGFDFSLVSTSTIQFKHAAVAFMGAMQCDAWSKPREEFPWFICGEGEDLKLALGAAIQCGGILWYRQD